MDVTNPHSPVLFRVSNILTSSSTSSPMTNIVNLTSGSLVDHSFQGLNPGFMRGESNRLQFGSVRIEDYDHYFYGNPNSGPLRFGDIRMEDYNSDSLPQTTTMGEVTFNNKGNINSSSNTPKNGPRFGFDAEEYSRLNQDALDQTDFNNLWNQTNATQALGLNDDDQAMTTDIENVTEAATDAIEAPDFIDPVNAVFQGIADSAAIGRQLSATAAASNLQGQPGVGNTIAAHNASSQGMNQAANMQLGNIVGKLFGPVGSLVGTVIGATLPTGPGATLTDASGADESNNLSDPQVNY